MHNGPPLDTSEESGDEILWRTVCGSEPDDTIAGADMRVAGSMKSNEECAAKKTIACPEISETERRAVGGEGGIRGRNLVTGSKRLRREAEIGVGSKGMTSARTEIGSGGGHAGLMTVNRVSSR